MVEYVLINSHSSHLDQHVSGRRFFHSERVRGLLSSWSGHRSCFDTSFSTTFTKRERERKCAANCNLPLHGSVIWFTHLSLPWLRVGWLVSSLIPINDAHCTSSSSDDHKDCFPPQKALACSRSSGCFDHKPGIMGVFFLIGRPDLKVFFLPS